MTAIDNLIGDLSYLGIGIGDDIVEEVLGDSLTELLSRVDVLVEITKNLDKHLKDVNEKQHWFHSKRKAIGSQYPNGFQYRSPIEVLYTSLKNRKVWQGDAKTVAHHQNKINDVIELSKVL